jgi:hypothetical protein
LESFAVEGIAMNDASANPIFVVLLFILRCAVPLAILFGVSYLLRKMGLVAIESPEPPDDRVDAAVEDVAATSDEAATLAQDAAAQPQEIVKEGLEPSEANPNETITVENNKES